MTLRVLIVDDSELFSDLLSSILEQDPEIVVVGLARDGQEAVEMAARLSPDLITMDLSMPKMDGLTAVESIMTHHPAPILVLTEDDSDLGDLTFEALRRGALDVRRKPTLLSRVEAQALRTHVAMLAGVRVRKLAGTLPSHQPRRRAAHGELVVVGVVASTGGPAAINRLLTTLPQPFPGAIVIVQHLPEGFVATFADWLARVTGRKVRLAGDGERLSPGDVLIAPDGADLTVTADGAVRLAPPSGRRPHCPSGDVLLSSLADNVPERAIGVILTGMGRDGSEGLAALRRRGGATLAQDESSSVVFGMPKAAMDSGAAGRSASLDELPSAIAKAMEAME